MKKLIWIIALMAGLTHPAEVWGDESDYKVIDQAKCHVFYDYTIGPKSSTTGNPFTAPVVLQIGPKYSRFSNYTSVRSDSFQYERRGQKITLEDLQSIERGYFTNLELFDTFRCHSASDSVNTYASFTVGLRTKTESETHFKILSLGTTYTGYWKEPAPDVEWLITDEKKNIGDVEVTKATGRLHGRDWTVWFAESLPYFEGPWELAGLPGLILEATYSEGIHHFELTKIQSVDTPILLKGRSYKLRDRSKILQMRSDEAAALNKEHRIGNIPYPSFSDFLELE